MAAAADTELRQRLLPEDSRVDGPELQELPYSGKVFMARKKKPDPWWVTICEVCCIFNMAKKKKFSFW